MDVKRDKKAVNLMNGFFYGSFVLQWIALVAVVIGLVARAQKHHWGVWFSIPGWIAFLLGYVIRSWVRRWFYNRNGK